MMGCLKWKFNMNKNKTQRRIKSPDPWNLKVDVVSMVPEGMYIGYSWVELSFLNTSPNWPVGVEASDFVCTSLENTKVASTKTWHFDRKNLGLRHPVPLQNPNHLPYKCSHSNLVQIHPQMAMPETIWFCRGNHVWGLKTINITFWFCRGLHFSHRFGSTLLPSPWP